MPARRNGNPINLCLVYMLLARRLGSPIVGVILPGPLYAAIHPRPAKFYIDAFNRGKLMTKADCVDYLMLGNYDLRAGAACSCAFAAISTKSTPRFCA